MNDGGAMRCPYKYQYKRGIVLRISISTYKVRSYDIQARYLPQIHSTNNTPRTPTKYIRMYNTCTTICVHHRPRVVPTLLREVGLYITMQRLILTNAASSAATMTSSRIVHRLPNDQRLPISFQSSSSSWSWARATNNNGAVRDLSSAFDSSQSTPSTTTTSRRHQRPIYVAATRQHVGKTSVSLALVSHFTKRFGIANVGYMKAVGQQCLRVWEEPPPSSSSFKEEGHYVVIDRDVKLIRDHFQMHHLQYADMSPILIPQGYTKSYLDGQIDHEQQIADIRRAYLNIVKATNRKKSKPDSGASSTDEDLSITICEGTGHAGVGSIVGTGNARVAEELGADVVLVANGGLGRAFDELQLNRALFLVSEELCRCL
jgi:dethiobiotin synthetase